MGEKGVEKPIFYNFFNFIHSEIVSVSILVYCISVCYLLVLYNHNLNVIMMLTENQIYQQYWNNYIQQLQDDFSFSLTASLIMEGISLHSVRFRKRLQL